MIRVAFTLLGGTGWLGGRHYLLNLMRSIRTYQPSAVKPVLFVGEEIPEDDVGPFRSIDGVEIVVSPYFSARGRSWRRAQAMVWGQDVRAARLFHAARIDVVFEPAQFYGWRLPMPAIAWIPDFQDRHLPHMFTRKAHLQKWIGQWTQALARRLFMLSSEDARRDCERFYPLTRGRTRVVKFAVPPPPPISGEVSSAMRALYGLPDRYFFLPNQLWAHKNHTCVVRALKILKAERHDVVVAVTGNPHDMRHGSYYGKLMEEVSAGELQRNFRFLGIVPYDHVLALMQTGIAIINPSRCEGWSTTVEEAKATGTPLILSDLAVHREQAGNSALYFSPDRPEELARHLREFRALPDAERIERAARSRTDTAARMAEFAEAFCDLARESLTRRRILRVP